MELDFLLQNPSAVSYHYCIYLSWGNWGNRLLGWMQLVLSDIFLTCFRKLFNATDCWLKYLTVSKSQRGLLSNYQCNIHLINLYFMVMNE